jgi:hypothetical protein
VKAVFTNTLSVESFNPRAVHTRFHKLSTKLVAVYFIVVHHSRITKHTELLLCSIKPGRG